MALLGLLFLFCVLLIPGCAERDEPEQVEITLVHGWGGTLNTHKTMQAVYDEFSEENPDIRLICIPYSDSSIAVQRANDMLAVGKMPDIVSTNGLSYYMNHAVKRDKAMDLMPYLERDKAFKNMIHPSVFESWETGNGHLYTVPDALEVAGYWYNREYMKAAGIVDEAGEIAEPKTWEEFLDMARKLKAWTEKVDEDISVCSLEQLQMLEFLFPARLAGEGAQGLALLSKATVAFDRETLAPVMRDLGVLEGLSKPVENIESARQDFNDGKSVLYFNGIWESNALTEENGQEDIGYSAYPFDGTRQLAYISASSGYVVAKQKNEKKSEACIRFLKYMLSEEVQRKLAVSTGQMPSNPNVDWEKVRKENPVLAGAIDKMYEAEIPINMIRTVWTEEKVDIVGKYMEAGEFDAESAGRMAEELNRKGK